MIALSALWFVSAWVFHVTNRNSKDGVFGAPVWALVVLVLIPLSTLAILTPCLLRARWEEEDRLHPLDYCGLVSAVSPLVFVGILILISFVSR
jgi:hypothetical protein